MDTRRGRSSDPRRGPDRVHPRWSASGWSWIEFPRTESWSGPPSRGSGTSAKANSARHGRAVVHQAQFRGTGRAVRRPGPVSIGGSNLYGWKATVSFTVPDVPTGQHWVHVVNAQVKGSVTYRWGHPGHTHPAGSTALVARTRPSDSSGSGSANAEPGQARQEQLRADLADRGGTIVRQAQRLDDVGARSAFVEAELAARRTGDCNAEPVWPILLLCAVVVALTATAFRWAAAVRRLWLTAPALQATRTLVTGARRSWTLNHEAPASAEPNTAPDVAPK